jgi:hypothetical protein
LYKKPPYFAETIKHPLFRIAMGLPTEIGKLGVTEIPHLAHATPLTKQSGLDESQVKAGNAVNELTRWVDIQGGPGTGKSRTAALAYAARDWSKHISERADGPKPITLMLCKTNNAAANLAGPLLKAGVPNKYFVSMQYGSMMMRSQSVEGDEFRRLLAARVIAGMGPAEDVEGGGKEEGRDDGNKSGKMKGKTWAEQVEDDDDDGNFHVATMTVSPPFR